MPLTAPKRDYKICTLTYRDRRKEVEIEPAHLFSAHLNHHPIKECDPMRKSLTILGLTLAMAGAVQAQDYWNPPTLENRNASGFETALRSPFRSSMCSAHATTAKSGAALRITSR